MRTIKAATAYWGAVFTLAFVIGALRVTWLTPRDLHLFSGHGFATDITKATGRLRLDPVIQRLP